MVVNTKQDMAVVFAKNASAIEYEDIPPRAVEVTKQHVLDFLATCIGGSNRHGYSELVDLIREWGGKEEATILGHGFRVPALHAAWANAAMANALDFDDCDDRTGNHGGAAVIAAALAAAELRRPVKGKDFLCALALGLDISYRLALAHRPKTEIFGDGWWNTQLYGYIAAPVSVGKILGLSQDQLISAMGHAYEEAGGNIQWVYDGALSKMMIGCAARASIPASLLAQRGVRGSQNTLGGVAGMFKTYLGNNIDYTALTADLGKRFTGAETGFKAYPCCRLNHVFIDATLSLRKSYNLKPEDVLGVTVTHGKTLRLNTEPLETKRSPRTMVDAQFSVPWTVAVAIIYGKVAMEHFTSEAIKDRAVLNMTGKISCRLDEGLTPPDRVIEPGAVEIKTRDAKILSKRVDYPLGSTQNPMGWENFATKLEQCAPLAAKPVAKGNQAKLVEAIQTLEALDDVCRLVELLQPSV